MTRNFLIPFGMALLFAILLFQPVAVYAVNGQTPNWQVLSSNVNNDYNSFARVEETTSQAFHVSSSDPSCGADCFDIQVNAFTDGGGYNCQSYPYPCNYVWAVQGFVDVVHDIGGAIGAWVNDAGIEVWNGGNGPFAPCWLYTNGNYNINGSTPPPGPFVQEEFFLHSATQLTNSLYVLSTSGTTYSNSVTCNYPNGWTVSYLNQDEGVIVGYAASEHASFSPLNAQLFSGYVDIVSNYNMMSCASEHIITFETSNLYQTNHSCTGGIYSGNRYVYSALFDENTESGT